MYLIGFFTLLVILNSSFVCSEFIKGLLNIYLLQRPEFRLNHEMYAPVAQLDRVLDYESRGRGFESSPVRHINQRLSGNYAGPFVFRGNIWGNKLISFITLAVVSLREV